MSISSVGTESVDYESQGARISAYLGRPARAAAQAGLVIVHGNTGLNEFVQRITRRFAEAGYLTIAPNLYSRIGGTEPSKADKIERARAIDLALPNEQVLADVLGGYELLRSRADVRGRIGLFGFCSGGRQGFYITSKIDRFACFLCFYGGVIMRPSTTHDEKERSYLPLLQDIRCPLQYHVGDRDHVCPRRDVEKLQAELQRHRKQAEIYVYEGRGHGFLDEESEHYEAETATLAWGRGLRFLAENLRS